MFLMENDLVLFLYKFKLTPAMKKIIKHIAKEGSREHVIWWDSYGSHCSEPECEINHRGEITQER